MSNLAALKELFAKLSDEERAALAGELGPVNVIAPVKPEVTAYSAQDAGGKITSIRFTVKSGNSRRPPVNVAPVTAFSILAYADEAAIECADIATQFPVGKLVEGNASWEAAFTELAEVLAAPLAAWREKFAPKKATKPATK